MARLKAFKDRTQAGELLAERLAAYAGRSDVILLALPRGGVPVAFAISRKLNIPLDVLIVRKLGVPGHAEYAMGAVASGGIRVLQQNVLDALDIPSAAVEAITQRELHEIERREALYRDDRPTSSLRERIVILVDDGLATGATMLAAVQAVRQEEPARVIIAVPVAAPDTCEKLAAEADEVICLNTPSPFYAVGIWYEDFSQTSDDEVRNLLRQAGQ